MDIPNYASLDFCKKGSSKLISFGAIQWDIDAFSDGIKLSYLHDEEEFNLIKSLQRKLYIRINAFRIEFSNIAFEKDESYTYIVIDHDYIDFFFRGITLSYFYDKGDVYLVQIWQRKLYIRSKAYNYMWEFSDIGLDQYRHEVPNELIFFAYRDMHKFNRLLHSWIMHRSMFKE